MKYVALLRGINVGGNHRVEMLRLKSLMERLDYTGVVTYINSGNIFFASGKTTKEVTLELEEAYIKEFWFAIPTLVKTTEEIHAIANALPKDWLNNQNQKTDVAYLFEEIDYPKVIDELPLKREYIDIRYIEGAIFWNVSRENLEKSHLGKIIKHKLYKQMTIRNANAARYLSDKWKEIVRHL